MLHLKILEQNDYDADNNMLLVKKDPTLLKNDTYVLSVKGERLQKVKYIKAIHTDKVPKGYCMLELSETRGVDDVPTTVGGSPTLNELKEQL